MDRSEASLSGVSLAQMVQACRFGAAIVTAAELAAGTIIAPVQICAVPPPATSTSISLALLLYRSATAFALKRATSEIEANPFRLALRNRLVRS